MCQPPTMNRSVSSLAELSALVICKNESDLIQLKNDNLLPPLIYSELKKTHIKNCLSVMIKYYVNINGDRICSFCRMIPLFDIIYSKSSTVMRIQSTNWDSVRDLFRCTLCEYFLECRVKRNTCHCENI